MTIAWLALLIFGIIAIITGAKRQEYMNSTYWFLIAFWAFFVLSPWATVLTLH